MLLRNFWFSFGIADYCIDKSFSNPLRLFVVFVEPCLWSAKQICSIDYHAIKLTELVGHSL